MGSVCKSSVCHSLKKVLFDVLVRSKLVYGGEVWLANKDHVGKLETVQNDFVRSMYTSGKIDCTNIF